MRKIILLLIAFLLLSNVMPADEYNFNIGGCGLAYGDTFYVNGTTGDDGDNGTTDDLAKATIQAGIGLLSAGDVLTIADGTYTTDANRIYGIPSGNSEDGYTTVQATNDFGVTLDAIADGDLDGAGTAETDSWFTTNCATDFAGNSWEATPSVGAWEVVSAGGGVIKTILALAIASVKRIGGLAIGSVKTKNGAATQ